MTKRLTSLAPGMDRALAVDFSSTVIRTWDMHLL